MPSQAEMRTWMDIAFDEAMAALAAGGAPIGAVVLNSDGIILGRRW